MLILEELNIVTIHKIILNQLRHKSKLIQNLEHSPSFSF